MTRHHLALRFTSNDAANDLPAASARIVVSGANGNEVFISHECTGPDELKQEVARLKEDLDQAAAEGAKQFAKYRRTL